MFQFFLPFVIFSLLFFGLNLREFCKIFVLFVFFFGILKIVKLSVNFYSISK